MAEKIESRRVRVYTPREQIPEGLSEEQARQVKAQIKQTSHIGIIIQEGKANKLIDIAYYSESDQATVHRTAFPYEIKGGLLFYHDFEKGEVRCLKLSNLSSVRITDMDNPGTPYPCKL